MSKEILLSEDELVQFGLRYTYGQLIQEGYEVLNVRPEKDVDPQILAKKQDQLIFVVVRTAVFPDVGDLPSINRIKQIREHAEKNHALAKFVSIGLMNAAAKTEEDKSKLYKGGEFYVNYSGLHELIRLTGDQF